MLGTPAVWIGIAITVAAQIAFTYAPPLQAVFSSAALAPAEAAVALALGPLLLVAVEIGKWAVAKGWPGTHLTGAGPANLFDANPDRGKQRNRAGSASIPANA